MQHNNNNNNKKCSAGEEKTLCPQILPLAGEWGCWLHTGRDVTQAKGRSMGRGFSGSDPGPRLGRGIGKGIKD